MTTLRQAIQEAITHQGDDSLWSDGGEDWRLSLYIEAQDEAMAQDDSDEDWLACPAYYNGRDAIMPVDQHGYIGSVAILSRRG